MRVRAYHGEGAPPGRLLLGAGWPHFGDSARQAIIVAAGAGELVETIQSR
jgi:hypothetical protein